MGQLVSLLSRVVVGFVALALVATVVLVLGSGRDHHKNRVEPVALDRLVAATTSARLPKAPRDRTPLATTDGLVVRPGGMQPIYDAPSGHAFAKLPAEQFGQTWLPVIDRRPGWVRVLLPSRPNGSTGWLRASGVELRTSAYLVRVHLGSRTLDLTYDGRSVGSWPVAVGKPSTPTPTGRTFVLGSVVDDAQSFSPVILPLGAHSDTLDTYGGGPGTVALHGWPDASVFGTAVSHGCVRVPTDALDRLSDVPLGTLVIVDNS